MNLFQDYDNPTKFDKLLVKMFFNLMTADDRKQFEKFIIETFGDDITECMNIARTINFVRMNNE